MKKIIITATAAVLTLGTALSLTGCGSQQSPGSTETTAEAAQTTAAATEAATTQAETTAENAQTTFDPESAVFNYNDYKITLNGKMDEIKDKLGEAKSVDSQLSCHGEGEDKTYTYEGFTINTYPLDGEEHILEINITEKGIPTDKGVEVGDSADKVTELYGTGYKEVGLYYAYDAGDKKSLQFLIEDGKVTEIDYYYNV